MSVRTVGNWQKRGIIPYLQISKRFVRFDLSEVKAALEQLYKVQPKAKSKACRCGRFWDTVWKKLPISLQWPSCGPLSPGLSRFKRRENHLKNPLVNLRPEPLPNHAQDWPFDRC